MTKYQLIYPMAFYVFFIFALAIYMFRTRVQALKNKEIRFDYFKTYTGTSPQEKTLVVSRHFDNQFQIPVLFLITCTVFMTSNQASYLTLILAWAFVVTRLVHSWIHLGSNNVPRRAMAYGLGLLVLLMMWIQLMIQMIIPAV